MPSIRKKSSRRPRRTGVLAIAGLAVGCFAAVLVGRKALSRQNELS